RCIDSPNGHFAKYRADISRHRTAPLRSVLHVITPASLFRSDEGITALVEGHDAGGFERSVGTLGPSRFDRINSLISQLSTIESLLPCLSDTDCIERAKTHLSLFLPTISAHFWDRIAKHPALVGDAAVLRLDLEIEAAAVGIHSRPLCSLDLKRL